MTDWGRKVIKQLSPVQIIPNAPPITLVSFSCNHLSEKAKVSL